VTSDGRAYCFGRTHDLRNALRVTRMHETWPKLFFQFFKLVGGNASIDYLEPTDMHIPGFATKVRCSAGLTAVTTDDGKVYMLGANRFGQCGIGTRTAFEWQPTALKGMEDEVVRDVQLGFQHGVCVTESGHAYAWGKGLTGQLGSDVELLELPRPDRVPLFERENLRVVGVGAGFNHSVFLTGE
jgi:alpha-tubulin suppressor-like RCC1 family protein